ncbi:MAG: hypothetical protein O9289_06060 [Rhodobacteraceae bacterium]|nr:hypothetical protein [Paracoccaceae bacterium]MCZ8082751.1 hypothetical protein [Paracoccaceae bacterium]
MTRESNRWLPRLRILSVIAMTGLCAWFIPASRIDTASSELTALFSLLMAGVLPTMALTANSLRPGNLSVKTIGEYGAALRRQMNVWIGLFLISLIACLALILGKLVNWEIVLPLSAWQSRPSVIPDEVNLSSLLTMCVFGPLLLILFRAIDIGNGVLSLLRLSLEISLSEAKKRDEDQMNDARKAIEEMEDREGFGAYVELRH